VGEERLIAEKPFKKRRRRLRDADDLVRGLAVEFEIEFGFGTAVVPCLTIRSSLVYFSVETSTAGMACRHERRGTGNGDLVILGRRPHTKRKTSSMQNSRRSEDLRYRMKRFARLGATTNLAAARFRHTWHYA